MTSSSRSNRCACVTSANHKVRGTAASVVVRMRARLRGCVVTQLVTQMLISGVNGRTRLLPRHAIRFELPVVAALLIRGQCVAAVRSGFDIDAISPSVVCPGRVDCVVDAGTVLGMISLARAKP